MNSENSQQNFATQSDEISLLPILKIVIRNRWFLIGMIILGLFLGYMKAVVYYKKVYTASSSILLQSAQKVTSRDYSKIYLDSIVQNTCDIIANSTTTARNLILEDYTYTNSKGQKVKTNLLGFYRAKDIDSLAGMVSKNIKLDYDQRTRVLTISYTTSNPEVSAQIVNNVIDQINAFYNSQMTSESLRNLNFVNDQLKTAKKNLDDARLKLALFVKRNREIQTVTTDRSNTEITSYSLAKLELIQLQEDVKAKESFYNSLVTQNQDLTVQSEQNAPSVIVLQQAYPPQNPLPRQTTKYSIIGAFLMFIIGLIIILLKNIKEVLQTRENIFEFAMEMLKEDFAKAKRFVKRKA